MMVRFRFRFFCFLLSMLAALFSAQSAWATGAGQQRLVVFGDSLSDTGNAFYLLGTQSTAPYQLIPDAPYAIGGHHFSNGSTWIEELARELHTTSLPVYQNPGQTNYAVGGARARGVGPFDLNSQVSLYLSQYAGADPGNLHIIMIGGNDIRDALVAFSSDPTGQTSFGIIQDAVTAVVSNVGALAQSGATRFLVVSAPDLGLVPAVQLQGQDAIDGARFLSYQFNLGLNGALDQLQTIFPVQIKRFDLFALITQIAGNPEEFGLSNVSLPCLTPGVIAGALCVNPNGYMFWDGIHPTRQGHKLIGQAVTKLFKK